MRLLAKPFVHHQETSVLLYSHQYMFYARSVCLSFSITFWTKSYEWMEFTTNISLPTPLPIVLFLSLYLFFSVSLCFNIIIVTHYFLLQQIMKFLLESLFSKKGFKVKALVVDDNQEKLFESISSCFSLSLSGMSAWKKLHLINVYHYIVYILFMFSFFSWSCPYSCMISLTLYYSLKCYS